MLTFYRLCSPLPPRVFTDYSRTTETGGFLRLELNTFATFAVDARTGKELDEVDAVEVCLVLALFGKTDQSVPSKRAMKACSSKASQSLSNTKQHATIGLPAADQALEFCFSLIDADRSGSIERVSDCHGTSNRSAQ